MKQISFWQTCIMTALLMAMTATVKAQQSELTLDDLFATPKLTGTTPSRPAWTPNSEHFAFSWNEPGNPRRGLWVSTSNGKEVRLISNTASASVRDIVWADANTMSSACEVTDLWQTSLSQGDDLQFMPVMRQVHVICRYRQAATKRRIYVNGDLWLAHLPYLNRIVSSRRSAWPVSRAYSKGRYSRPEREIGPGIWSGPTYKWSPDGKTIAFHVR